MTREQPKWRKPGLHEWGTSCRREAEYTHKWDVVMTGDKSCDSLLATDLASSSAACHPPKRDCLAITHNARTLRALVRLALNDVHEGGAGQLARFSVVEATTWRGKESQGHVGTARCA